MRVRIILRGLIVVTHECPRPKDATGPVNRGRSIAWLISHPDPMTTAGATATASITSGVSAARGMPMSPADAAAGAGADGMDMSGTGDLHVHVPRISIYGRNADTGAVIENVGMQLAPGETTFELRGHSGLSDGVSTTDAYDRHVPNLGQLREARRGEPDMRYVTSRIILPSGGTLRPRDMVSWDDEVDQAAEVAFMGTNFRGYVANEVVLDLGDDSDFDCDEPEKFLSVESTTDSIPCKLWPRTKGQSYVQATDPNTVEILITNFAPQGVHPVFWSKHLAAAFYALGYEPDASFEHSPQYTSFVEQAKKYDADEWTLDEMLAPGQPFPYVNPESVDEPAGLEKKRDPLIITRPPHDLRPRPHVKLQLADPWARPICPVGQDDINPNP